MCSTCHTLVWLHFSTATPPPLPAPNSGSMLKEKRKKKTHNSCERKRSVSATGATTHQRIYINLQSFKRKRSEFEYSN